MAWWEYLARLQAPTLRSWVGPLTRRYLITCLPGGLPRIHNPRVEYLSFTLPMGYSNPAIASAFARRDHLIATGGGAYGSAARLLSLSLRSSSSPAGYLSFCSPPPGISYLSSISGRSPQNESRGYPFLPRYLNMQCILVHMLADSADGSALLPKSAHHRLNCCQKRIAKNHNQWEKTAHIEHGLLLLHLLLQFLLLLPKRAQLYAIDVSILSTKERKDKAWHPPFAATIPAKRPFALTLQAAFCWLPYSNKSNN